MTGQLPRPLKKVSPQQDVTWNLIGGRSQGR
jgi:hypothetical protein